MTNVANMMDDSNVNAPSHVQVIISKADAAGKSDEKNASENGGAKDVDGDSAQERGTSKSSDAETTVGTISGDLESCVRTFYSRLNDWIVGKVEKNMDELSKVDNLLDENFEKITTLGYWIDKSGFGRRFYDWGSVQTKSCICT